MKIEIELVKKIQTKIILKNKTSHIQIASQIEWIMWKTDLWIEGKLDESDHSLKVNNKFKRK